ncbi:MAG: hypothetical protein JKX88_11025, partial [Marinicaulis sp.]|nr:hypothetical protein [Marinicaulis sp.]
MACRPVLFVVVLENLSRWCYHIIFTGAYDLVTINAADEVFDPDLQLGRMRAGARWFAYMAPQTLAKWILLDARNLAVWAPVAIGCGAGVYFGLKVEPYWLMGVAAMLMAGLSALHPSRFGKVGLAVFLGALGFVAADWRTSQVAAPMLERELSIRMITGRLISVEDKSDVRRMIIALSSIDYVDEESLPARARISW